MKIAFRCSIVIAAAIGVPGAHAAADPETLMRQSNCFTCHSVDKEKNGLPSFKDVASKYRGKPDGEQKVRAFVATHQPLKSTDDADVKAVVQWILSR